MAKQKEIALDNAQEKKVYPLTEKIKSIGYWGKIDNSVFSIKPLVIGAMFDPKNGTQKMGKTADAECYQTNQFTDNGEPIFGEKNEGEIFIDLTLIQAFQLQRAGVIK